MVTLLIRNGEQVYSQWIDSISSATKCIKTSVKTSMDSFDSGYIRYSLLEPSFITNKNEFHVIFNFTIINLYIFYITILNQTCILTKHSICYIFQTEFLSIIVT